MSLIQAREIIWIDIIETVKNVWDLLAITREEKNIVRDLEGIIVENKKKLENGALSAKRLIDFINSKSKQELKEFGIEDKTQCVLELENMIVKNS